MPPSNNFNDNQHYLPPQEAAVSSTTVADATWVHSVPTATLVASALGTTLNQNVQDDVTLDNDFNPILCDIVTPVHVDILSNFLVSHPHRDFVNFLIQGFRHGFRIGYEGPITFGQCHNLLSARSQPVPVTKAILKELERGHTSGPFLSPPFDGFHCSPLGAVAKKDGSHRIIFDLSSPLGSSINEGISSTQYSVKYSSFDDAVELAGCNLEIPDRGR